MSLVKDQRNIHLNTFLKTILKSLFGTDHRRASQKPYRNPQMFASNAFWPFLKSTNAFGSGSLGRVEKQENY